MALTSTVASFATPTPYDQRRAVLVHDYLNQYGGAERVLEAFHGIFPGSPIYTSMYDPRAMPAEYRSWDIRTSWIDRVPGAYGHHQALLPLYPLAFERLHIPECDVVLSSSSAFAKMVAPPPGAVHVSYIHSPMRFAWNFEQYCERERVPHLARRTLPPLMRLLRRRDRITAARVDRFIANSTAVRDRIRAFWRRDATVIFPPVDVERFRPAPPSEIGDYFLVISRLVPYKRIDLVIETFNSLGLPLWIVGDGRDRRALERRAGPNIRFLGRISDAEMEHVTARCRAAVFMSEDDFGIAQVEVQTAGRPVIALARGGVLDSVIPGETGVWVANRSVESLRDALREFDALTFSTDRLTEHASKFSSDRFRREILAVVEEALARDAEKRSDRWN